MKFVGLAVQKIWRTMCISINGHGDLEISMFNAPFPIGGSIITAAIDCSDVVGQRQTAVNHMNHAIVVQAAFQAAVSGNVLASCLLTHVR